MLTNKLLKYFFNTSHVPIDKLFSLITCRKMYDLSLKSGFASTCAICYSEPIEISPLKISSLTRNV